MPPGFFVITFKVLGVALPLYQSLWLIYCDNHYSNCYLLSLEAKMNTYVKYYYNIKKLN